MRWSGFLGLRPGFSNFEESVVSRIRRVFQGGARLSNRRFSSSVAIVAVISVAFAFLMDLLTHLIDRLS